MAVISVVQVSDGRGGGASAGNKRNYTLRFIVETDSNQDDAKVVIDATGIPRIGASYVNGPSVDLGSICESVVAEQAEKSPRLWLVTAEYDEPDKKDTQSEEEQDDNDTKQPELRPPEISIRARDIEKPTTELKCYSDMARTTLADVEASNGERFSPEPSLTFSVPVIQFSLVVRGRLSLQSYLNQWNNHVNDAIWNDFPAETLLIRFNGAEPFYENRKLYWKVTWELLYEPNTWKLSLLNVGTYEKTAGGIKLITDELGNVGVKKMLNFGGVVTTTPYYVDRWIYPTANLGVLFNSGVNL